MLLDEWRGFHPFTTWSTVTLAQALAIADSGGAQRIVTLGLTRAYLTRHGAGPLPTWQKRLDARLFDVGNRPNRWQGAMRTGWLDLVLLRYALEAAGGAVDALAVSCLDELPGDALVATAYRLADGAILHRLPLSCGADLAHQERLAEMLRQATPIYEPISAAELPARLAAEFRPVAIRSTSPTWQGRTLDAAWRSALTSGRPFKTPSAPRPARSGPPAPSGSAPRAAVAPVA